MKEEIKEITNKMIKTSQPNGVFLTAKVRDKIIYYINNSLEEIERLNEENEELKKIQCTFVGTGCKVEIERLNNIIKEAIEYLKENACYSINEKCCDDLNYDECDELLEILDKENKQ